MNVSTENYFIRQGGNTKELLCSWYVISLGGWGWKVYQSMSMLHLDGIRPAVNLLGDVEQHTALWIFQ